MTIVRRTVRTGLAAAVVVALSGCAAGPPPRAAAAEQTVDVAGVWSGDEQASFQRVLAGFERQTGITATYTSAGDELPTVLQTRIAGGSPPDVAVLPQPGLVAGLARRGRLAPLGPDTAAIVDEQYAPVWKGLGTVDGTLYGVVFKAANKSVVWFNAHTLGPGFVPPVSFTEFVDLLRQRSDTGATPLAVGGADGWTLTDWFENVYLQTAGPENYDKLTRHEIPWTDPTVRVALDRLATVFRPEFMPGGTVSALQTEFAGSVSDVFGANPTASIVYEGDFVAGVIKKDTSAAVGTDARFFPFPGLGGRHAVVVGGDTVVAMRDRPAAQALVTYLASADAASLWAFDGGFLSPNRQVDPSSYPDEVTREIATGLSTADTVRFDMSDLMPASLGGTKGDGLWKAMQDFLADPAKVDAILADLEAKAVSAYQAG